MVGGYKPFLKRTTFFCSERFEFSNQVVKLMRRGGGGKEKKEEDRERESRRSGSSSLSKKLQYLDFIGLLWTK